MGVPPCPPLITSVGPHRSPNGWVSFTEIAIFNIPGTQLTIYKPQVRRGTRCNQLGKYRGQRTCSSHEGLPPGCTQSPVGVAVLDSGRVWVFLPRYCFLTPEPICSLSFPLPLRRPLSAHFSAPVSRSSAASIFRAGHLGSQLDPPPPCLVADHLPHSIFAF